MDRFYRGTLSGVIAGVFMNVWSELSHDLLKFTKYRFIDWTAIVIYGYPPNNIWQSYLLYFYTLSGLEP